MSAHPPLAPITAVNAVTARAAAGAAAARPAGSWQALHAEVTAPYRAAGRFGWHFARGKFGRDPVFRHFVESGLLGPEPVRVVDLGCGQALIASLGRVAARWQAQGRWPAAWPALALRSYVGVELMPRDVARAGAALGTSAAPVGFDARLVCGDMRSTPLPPCDRVVILDVLHYVDHAAQTALLMSVRAALGPRGRLLLRVGDRAAGTRYAVSQWVDHTVTRLRGHRVPPTWGRPLAEWVALLESLGFAVQARPMSAGTPFANVLLLADLKGAA